MLKLKLQYFGHLTWRTGSLEKTLMLGKVEGRSSRGRQRMRWLMASPTQWTWVWVNSRSWWWTEKPGVLQSMGYTESDTTEWLNWTELRKALSTTARSSFSHHQSLPSTSLHKLLSPIHQRADRRRSIVSQRLKQKPYYRKLIMMKKQNVIS